MKQHSSQMKKRYSPLIGAALAAASLFHFSLPAFAIGTSAGTLLRNTATGSYDDQNNQRYNVTSNEVTVTVGKIAGITNVPSGFTDASVDTPVLPNDEVSFDFKVTNTGNDATDIFIPAASNITVENLTDVSVAYFQADGTTPIPASRITTTADGGARIANVDENAFIIVRVTGDVSATAAQNDNVLVQLGDTGTNTDDLNSTDFPGTQNQPDIDSTVANDVQERDVRTLTAADTNTAVNGDPVNDQREASAKQIVPIGSQPLALPRIEKVNAGVADATPATPNDLSDNIITYNLNLEVAGDSDTQVQTYDNFPFNAADLEGRDYSTAAPGPKATFDISSLPQADQTNLVVVSDAVPANTTIDLSSIDSPNANWIQVYTTDALTTAADEASWTAIPNDTSGIDASTVTRVGWVYDARTSANGVITAGSNVTGFGFDVVTTGLTNNTATAIYNIAQIFGSTDDDAAGTGGLITYDESGDQNPANLNDNGNFGPDETTTTSITDTNDLDGDSDTTETLNVFGYDNNPAEANQDRNNDNTGTGNAGEYNVVTVAPDAVASDILNGPGGDLDDDTDNSPGAIGDIFGVTPADDNHDFQNLAAPDLNSATTTTNDDGYETTTYDPAPVVFTNSVTSPDQSNGLSNVILEPVSPEALGLSGTAADLPNGTTVTITFGNQSATYTYDPAGNGSFSFADGTTEDVVIDNIPRTETAEYTVSINLPNTALSTNFVGGDPDNELVGGYPVPVVAYLDDNGQNGLQNGDTYNVTVDQVYLGYLQLVKEARVLRDNGTRLVEVAGFDADDATKQPAPGDILEYRITYTNISDVQADDGASTGNVVLNADDVVITEDGILGDNNWAEDNDDPNEDGDNLMDTLHVLDGAEVTQGDGTIRYFNAAGTSNPSQSGFSDEVTDFGVTDDITKYEVRGITRLTPNNSGTFTFQRKITSQEDIENLDPTP